MKFHIREKINKNTHKEKKYITYFGYGSNMSIHYLNSRRNVFPVNSLPCKLYGFKLIMNMEGPFFIEPSFANIIKDKDDNVEGLLHTITTDEFEKIIKSEGENYEVKNIYVISKLKRVKAKILIYKTENKNSIPPSKRYMNILIKAALESNLSPEYIKKLRSHPYVYYPILSELISIYVYLWVWLRSRYKS